MTNSNNINSKLNSFEKTKELQIEAIQYLQASRMKNDEKEMWFAMLPYMDNEQLQRFVALLNKENKEVVNLYFSYLNK
ncbi:hypothetical protein IJ913_02355 [bacterium]|jgi:hypothetical protein|nr:hypothetical protein [bacterium]